MNSFKLALKNIRKSWSDYTVYFLTLIIGVAIFYMFNSIGTQGIMEDVSKSGNDKVKMLITAIEVVSVAVALVLGLLMIYANNFLIKRRKKEFGIYLLLGMNKKKVSKILVCETCIVGIVSMFIGLLLGIFGSQFLSIIVAKMFAVDVTSYTFAISEKAAVITVLSFLVIFFVVLLFNTGTISRYKLIDLINAEKKGEKQIIRNTKVSIALFIISTILLVIAYAVIGIFGNRMRGRDFAFTAGLVVIGTFVLFWSFVGFFQTVLSKSAGYKKGLTSFVVRQFSGNMNTSAFSFALISLLLLAAICAFSSGFSFRTYLNKRLGNATPVDLTMRVWSVKPTEYLASKGIAVEGWAKEYMELPVYESNEITIGDMVAPVIEEAKKTFMYARWDSAENVMRLSDYNKIERAFGREELKLNDDQYAVVSDFDLLNTFQIAAIKQGNKLTVGGKEYGPAYNSVNYEYILMSGLTASMGTIVLPDAAVDEGSGSFREDSYLLIANYKVSDKQGRYKTDALIMDKVGASVEAGNNGEDAPDGINIQLSTKNQVEDASIGISVIVVFLVLYIGIVFVVACAAIIALKVLSDSIDSVQKFRILSRIGAGEDMRKKALFIQVLMNFLLPLVVAFFGSVFMLGFIKGMLSSVGMVSLGPGMVISALIMLLIYGGYFLTTYEGCRKIVK
ncbi:MAG: ABC transporter permease [Lachnospiraceae bacterium]|nr:ABC transporter permease [Lachnospiraceae bacterium]